MKWPSWISDIRVYGESKIGSCTIKVGPFQHGFVSWGTIRMLIMQFNNSLSVGFQIPLFGIMSSDSADPFYWLRVIIASNRGEHYRHLSRGSFKFLFPSLFFLGR